MDKQRGYLLIVEDDPDIRKLLDTALVFKGFRVQTAPNGIHAIELIKKELPILVIADIMMPQLDGFSLVHRLRIDRPTRGIPVIFITATYVLPEDREFALSIGATRFIQKPVNIEEFLKVVEDTLSQEFTVPAKTMSEFEFYDGYRKRLEAKLDQKNKQLAREEQLKGTAPEAEKQDMQVSTRRAELEKEELKHLLEEIQKQLDDLKRAEEGKPATDEDQAAGSEGKK